ncbi:MAG: hypothetical protein JXQ30_15565 [Spirochaetes bacterium]|nr:hypothetical protein [Spirochaetota bacterium]
MRTVRILFIPVTILFLLFAACSCATVEKKAERLQGITGRVVLTDDEGGEIEHPPSEDILVNVVPVVAGERRYDRASRLFPSKDGTFFGSLEKGQYTIEVFLQGFYVRSIDVTMPSDRVIDLGTIELQRIRIDPGMPVKAEPEEGVILKEGDVNIEPPSF